MLKIDRLMLVHTYCNRFTSFVYLDYTLHNTISMGVAG